jgi:two-component system response regulator ResD
MKPRVLLVEDEPGLRMGLADGLRSEGFEVEERADGTSGLARAEAGGLDALVLDLMLPGLDGFEVLRRLRAARRALPVLVLSARGEDEDRIHGFEYGADDYVVKPAPLREIVLRLRAILRRTGAGAAPPERVRFGEVEADFAAYTLTRDGKRFGLNRLEAELLRFFLAHAGEPLDRNRLLVEVWGQVRPVSGTRTVDTHVFRLRQKIEDDPERPRHLHTLRGVGYRFDL